ncbi:MAG: signal peptidase I [Candidatus Bathyarchaeia archaeon]
MRQTLARWRGVIEVVVAVLLAALASGGFTFGLQRAMATSDPIVVVVSGSMVPTLQVGDLVIIQGVEPGEVKVGDIVVFQSPASPSEKIIHRVVKIEERYEPPDGGKEFWFTTKGDANSGPLPGVDHFPSRNLIGRAVRLPWGFSFPYLGYPAMLLEDMAVRAILWASFIALVAYSIFKELPRKKPSQGTEACGAYHLTDTSQSLDTYAKRLYGC